MPKREDIHKILIIGSGPIIIGQACEFDYSGTQACKALRSLGYQVVLVNSNPATIMTDPETADVTYIEPLNAKVLTEIIAQERPDALLPNLGGQSGTEPGIRAAPPGGPGRIRGPGHRGRRGRHHPRRGPPGIQGDHGPAGDRNAPQPDRHQRGGGRAGRRCPGLPGGPPAGLHHGRHRRRPGLQRRGTAHRGQPAAWRPAWSTRCWSRNRCWGGRSWSWRSCATPRIRSSRSASSKTSMPWGFTPATRFCTAPMLTIDKALQAALAGAGLRHRRGHRGHRRHEYPVRPRPGQRSGGGDRDQPAHLTFFGPGVEGDRLSHRPGLEPPGRRPDPG